MNLLPAPTQRGRDTASVLDTRLRGHWLVITRLAWFVILGLVVGMIIASIPTYFAYLHILTAHPNPRSQQLTQDGIRALHALGLSVDSYAIYNILLNAFFVLGFLLVGWVIFWHKADDRLAFFTSVALLTFPIGFVSTQTTTLPWPWVWLVQVVAFLSGCSLSLFFYMFPGGRFAPPWTGWLMLGWFVYEGAERFFPSSPANPFVRFPALYNGLFLGLLGSLVAVQVYRYRRVSTPFQRQQTKWVVFGSAVAILGLIGVVLLADVFFPAFFQSGTLANLLASAVLLLSLLGIPVSIGIAILRSHLWDINVIINRSLVYAGLSVGIVGMYVLVVVALGALFQAPGNPVVSLVATGLIAVLFQPLRLRLQHGVNRLMYGERDDPSTFLLRFGRQLEATLAPEAVLPTIVQTLAQALKLPYVAILLKQENEFTTVASYGELRDEPVTRSLVYQGETVGTLHLAPRSPGEAFTPADTRMFDELTRQISLVAHAVRLTADLKRSNVHLVAARARIVTAHEEERRRLRRDLHDGLGPTLAALTLKIGAARKLLPRDQMAADALLYELGSDIATTIGNIRQLVYNLRPPSLDELGLIGAIREHVTQQTSIRGSEQQEQLQVSLDIPDALPALSAAIEVATFRIVQEALTNVVRHACARTCSIRLWLDDQLSLQICDDGRGISATQRMGIGLRSMRERAAELGGTFIVEPVPTGGTCILAQLPIAKE